MELRLKIFSILTLLIASSQCQTETFTCEFFNQSFVDQQNTLCCFPKEKLTILAEYVDIDIKNAQQLKNIQGFSARDMQIKNLPRNIQKFFPNLEVLEIFQTGLKKISSRNLKNSKDLKYLSLSHNKIENLEANLFQHNRGLKTIILNNNKISSIEPTAFKGLTDLKHLQLQNNFCINAAESNHLDVENLIENAKISCSKIVSELRKQIRDVDEKFTKLIEEVEKLPVEQNDSSIWKRMKEWFKRYMGGSKNVKTNDEKVKVLARRTEDKTEIYQEDLIELRQNETYDSIINPVMVNINMTEILKEIGNLKEIITGNQEAKMKFKTLIFVLIALSLLTYSLNFMIMYWLYPKNELDISNLKSCKSVENIYNDIPVRFVPN